MSVGDRIKQVRELRGLTQAELANIHGKDQSFVANIEANRKAPPPQLIKAIAFQTGFPPAFFYQDSVGEFPEGSLAFRSHSGIPKRSKRRAYRYAQVAFELAAFLISRVNAAKVQLPRLEAPPAEAAAVLRAQLGIPPDRPIPNLTRALERLGVIVIQPPLTWPGIFAFSVWAGAQRERPVIVLTSDQSGDRLRLNLGHEVRHLTTTPNGTPREIEADANRFAGELLIPTPSIREQLQPPVTLTNLANLKRDWGISIQALVQQAYHSDIITKRQSRYLHMQIRQKGWRKAEPIKIPIERPRALLKMAELLYGNPPDLRRLAKDSSLSTALVRALLRPNDPPKSGPSSSPARTELKVSRPQ